MKKILLFVFCLVILTHFQARSQQVLKPEKNLPALTPDDQMMLSSIPLLELPAAYKGPNAPLLPISVDNSTQPYFRPITSQAGLECGQNAGISFNFTYEVDRLKNIPANTLANQFPSHFAWNFLNGGASTGVSCFDSWELVRNVGTPTAADYGGLTTGGPSRWINGYDKYYNALSNRINYMRAINGETPEGLLTLKYWLFDHLEGSAVGGVANFYGNYFSPNQTLPAGTPEAGKAVVTSWGSSPSHTWTICGYNDSIRYDFNGDGHYTNNIDINSDGVVDMHDWEIGGLKFANGYAGTGWGNQGFCYMMYKCLADAIGYGGIWNHRAYIIDVRQSMNVKMMMKITLKHTSRNKLRVTTGFSTNLAATTPDFVQDYRIFNFQGGDLYMQGGTTEADKTIEFGLDLTPLLNQISSGTPLKVFLQVQENDPSGLATGEVVSWSIMDYTTGSTPLITSYPTNNTPIANNTITRMSLNYTPVFQKPDITTATLPPANLYQPYSVQLAAANGASPYLWDVKMDYPETVSSGGFPTGGQPLSVTNNNTGYANVTLPFTFPFYNKSVNNLYIYADGYITFDNQPYTWPYIIDKTNLFHCTSVISPFMTDMILYSSQSDGIFYTQDASSVTIRWKSSIYNMQGTSGLNIAVKLYKNGKIEYYYGNMNYPSTTAWTGGLSCGDARNYQLSSLSGAGSVTAGTLVEWAPCGFPVEMSLSDDGLFTGTPQNVYNNQPIRFRITDNNNYQNTRVLNFSTNGLLVDYLIYSGNDSVIEFGETTNVTLKIRNVGNQTVHNVNATLSESDPYITLTDSTSFIGDIPAGQVVTVTNAFLFNVSSIVPDNHAFSMQIHISSTEHNFNRDMNLVAFAPDIRAGRIMVLDGDNERLDPGETTDIKVLYKNSGGAKVQNLVVNLVAADPALTINNGIASIGTLNSDSTGIATFNITASPNVAFEHLYKFNSALTASNGFSGNDSLFLFSGEIVEDFETGTLTKFPWFCGGFGYWYSDVSDHYEGIYAARSGWIYDNAESSLNLSVRILTDGDITFWKKVSCENDPNGTNYDWLGFFIDNVEQARWDGVIGWSRESFPLTTGYHTLKWVYHKDYSVSANADACWVDFITFPPFSNGWPVISTTPSAISKTLDAGQFGVDSLLVSNVGGGIMDFSVMVFDTTANKSVMAPDNLTGSYIECYTDGFIPGQTFSWTFAVHNNSTDNEFIREIKMDFPYQINVATATNFSGGTLGELVSNGITGPGANITWHGESSGGKGVIKPGESASTMITGTIQEDYLDDAFVVYSIRGDSTGAAPHDSAAHIRLKNFSLPNTWLTLSNNFGKVMHGNGSSVKLHFNASGVPAPSDWSCNVVARDKNNNKVTIPVVMHVNDTTVINGTGQSGNNLRVKIYPNPFRETVTLKYTLLESQGVEVTIFDYAGKIIRHLSSKVQDAGTFTLNWDGRDDRGNGMPSGVYILTMKAGNSTATGKLVKVN